MKRMNKQKGFTIIELVVVILLLGILTATALPRFMDVENQAHDAVVDAVRAGMVTSAGLFRAQWYAEGQPAFPTPVTDYDAMIANADGYPLGISSANIDSSTSTLYMTSSDACYDIYDSFLQPNGRPSIETLATGLDSLLDTDITSSTSDFIAYVDDTDETTGTKCYFVYTGQFTDAETYDLPYLIYDATTGNVTEGGPL
jgi:MSHA pilin protein MshB